MSSSNQKQSINKKNSHSFTYSMKCAWRGLKYVFDHEKNLRMELVIASLTAFLMVVFAVKSWEAIVLFLMIIWVITTELINTALERVVDIIKPRFHPYARLIKDIMAAVVLISAIASIIIAVLIFWPYGKELLSLYK